MARTSVTSAELVRRFGSWQDRASTGPVFVTHHGRERLVMLSSDGYRTLVERADPEAANDPEAARLTVLIDQLDMGFVAFDRALTVRAINPAACAFLDVARAAVLELPLADDLADLSHTLARTHLARTIATGEVGSFQLPSLSRPGQWLRFQTFPWGEGAACLFRTVTAEVEAHRSDLARETMARAIRAHGGIGAGRLTLRGTFAAVDEVLAGMAGFAASSLLQVRLTDVMPLGLRVQAAAEIETVLTGGGARAFDGALLVNNGGELPVRIALAELRGDYAIDGATVIATPR